MALNIQPTERNDGHEIVDLVYWSIPWLLGLSILLLFIGIQHIAFHFHNVMRVTLSTVYIATGISLYSLFRSERKYVASNTDRDLALTMSSLGSFWKAYSLVLMFSLGSLLGNTGRMDLLFMIPVVVALLLYWSFHSERKLAAIPQDLTKCISQFAMLNVKRVRFVAFFALMVGFTFLALYIMSFFIKINIPDITCLLWGISYIGIGTGAGLYWRKVRDINRNPSVIYFERSLERLNLYWLIFSVFSLVQLIANFL